MTVRFFFLRLLIIDLRPSVDVLTPGSSTEEGSGAMWSTSSSSGVWPCAHLTVAAKPGNREQLPHVSSVSEINCV